MKDLQTIQNEHSASATEIMNGYLDAINDIKSIREPDEGAYLDRLNDDQRLGLLREQKMERANEAHEQTIKAYTEEVERYHSQLSQRRTHLKKQLFHVDGPDGAAALSRAAIASEGDLAGLLDVAQQASNKDLARAAFVVAERKGYGDLLSRYFNEVDPDARSAYQEWSQLPSEEIQARQRENISRVIQPPDPDMLMPRAGAVT
jgi:hypothetical protein